MKAVLAAFRAPMSDGSEVRQLGLAEFRTFWTSITDKEKANFVTNANDMGFNE